MITVRTFSGREPQVGDIWRDTRDGELFVVEKTGSVYAGGASGRGYQGHTYRASPDGVICLQLTMRHDSFKEDQREGRWVRLRNYLPETSHRIALGLMKQASAERRRPASHRAHSPEPPAKKQLTDPLRLIVDECERVGLPVALTISSSKGFLLSVTNATDADALAQTMLDLGCDPDG